MGCRGDTLKAIRFIHGRHRAQGSCGFLHTWDPAMPQLCTGRGPAGGDRGHGQERVLQPHWDSQTSRQEQQQPRGEPSCPCLTYLPLKK